VRTENLCYDATQHPDPVHIYTLLRNLLTGLLYLHRDVLRRSRTLLLVLVSFVRRSCGHLQRLLAFVLAHVGRIGRTAGRCGAHSARGLVVVNQSEFNQSVVIHWVRVLVVVNQAINQSEFNQSVVIHSARGLVVVNQSEFNQSVVIHWARVLVVVNQSINQNSNNLW